MKNKVILNRHLSCALEVLSSNVIPFFGAGVHAEVVVSSLPTFLSRPFLVASRLPSLSPCPTNEG